MFHAKWAYLCYSSWLKTDRLLIFLSFYQFVYYNYANYQTSLFHYNQLITINHLIFRSYKILVNLVVDRAEMEVFVRLTKPLGLILVNVLQGLFRGKIVRSTNVLPKTALKTQNAFIKMDKPIAHVFQAIKVIIILFVF